MGLFTSTATHSMSRSYDANLCDALPNAIRKHTQWDYICTKTENGYSLNPTFRHMPYRNSFVPEIDITVSQNDSQTVLDMQGHPVTFVRIFMAIWFGFSLLMEVFLLVAAVVSALDSLFPMFIPMILGAFGYSLCKIATGKTFRSIVKAIQKEFP